jgi:outer membrane protein
MKKSLTSLIVGVILAASSSNLYAENLAEIYQLALQSDPAVQKAQAQALAAEEDIVQARAVLLPQLKASSTFSRGERDSQNYNDAFAPLGSTITSTADTTSYTFEVNMQIYRHDSWLRMSNAKKSAHRSDLNLNVVKQDLIVRVTQAYFDILSAKDDLEFAKAEQKAIERQLEQTKQRFAVGLTAITDVHEAQAQFDNAEADVIKAENKVYNTEEALRTITNSYPRNLSALDTTSFSTSTPMPNSANEWQQIAEAKSLDLILQKINVDIAKRNIDIAQAGHYPTIDFRGTKGASKDKSGFTTVNDTYQFPETPYYDNQNLSITLSVPLFSGGATSSLVRQAQHNYVAASQDMDLTYRDVVRKTRNAYNDVRAAISGIRALEQSEISAESALKATEAGFEVGTRTIVDVLNSTRNLYNAKRNLSSTRYGYIQAILALKRAGGTISGRDIADINQGLVK